MHLMTLWKSMNESMCTAQESQKNSDDKSASCDVGEHETSLKKMNSLTLKCAETASTGSNYSTVISLRPQAGDVDVEGETTAVVADCEKLIDRLIDLSVGTDHHHKWEEEGFTKLSVELKAKRPVTILIAEPGSAQSSASENCCPSVRKYSVVEPTDPVEVAVRQTPGEMNLSFCGCGFLGLYHLGVARTLAQHGRAFLSKVDKFCGASAGSLVAALLATQGPNERVLQASIDFCYNLAADVRKVRFKSLNPRVSLLRPLETFLSELLPEDAHVTASGKLYISVTRRGKNTIVSNYKSREELIKYLLASSYIPHVTGNEAIYIQNRRFFDGGMTNNLPVLNDGRTVTISPFAGRQDICPPDRSRKPLHMRLAKQRFRVNLKNIRRAYHAFLPPKREKMDKYFAQGMRDAENFLRREGFYVPSEEEEEEEGADHSVCSTSKENSR